MSIANWNGFERTRQFRREALSSSRGQHAQETGEIASPSALARSCRAA
jgi:hypothetical protein